MIYIHVIYIYIIHVQYHAQKIFKNRLLTKPSECAIVTHGGSMQPAITVLVYLHTHIKDPT